MLNWKQLSKIRVLPEFFRLIRRLFGVDIIIIDPTGKEGGELYRVRELNQFCILVQREPGGRRRCVECDEAHAAAAARNLRPLRYVCHAGLTEFIVPIVIDHAVIAHLQCGQVLAHPPSEAEWRRISQRLKWITGDKAALYRAYRRSPVISSATHRDLMSLLEIFTCHAAVSHARELLLEQEPHDRVVSKALAFLKSRFCDEIRLAQVAVAAGTSKRGLVRIVRDRTGATVLDHLHRLRIAYACEQLQRNGDKIANIGLDCGFGSIQQFNRVFRKLMRDTPRHWSNKNRSVPHPDVF